MIRKRILIAVWVMTACPLYAQGLSDIREDWEKYVLTENLERIEKPIQDTLPEINLHTKSGRQISTESIQYIGKVCWPMGTETGTKMRNTADMAVLCPVSFDFYGTRQQVFISTVLKQIRLKGITEKEVADFWMELSRINVISILEECEKRKEEFGYNDWAVFDWLQHLSNALFSSNQYAAGPVFTVYIMNQLGLMTRIARGGDRLFILFSAVQMIYGRKYVVLDTYPFYLADPFFPEKEIYTYSSGSQRRGRPLDLHLDAPIIIGYEGAYRMIQKSSSVFHKMLQLPVNMALMSFYSKYPQMDAIEYVPTRLDDRFETTLMGYLIPLVEGKSVLESVNLLLAFVQKDFDYKIDKEQFGHEKPFFPEENFIYAYNDCEDRSILFSYLVRKILRERVVLLDYEDHLAAAVRLKEELRGDYVKIQDEKYYVCDPSYINATAGISMPQYRNCPAKVWILGPEP